MTTEKREERDMMLNIRARYCQLYPYKAIRKPGFICEEEILYCSTCALPFCNRIGQGGNFCCPDTDVCVRGGSTYQQRCQDMLPYSLLTRSFPSLDAETIFVLIFSTCMSWNICLSVNHTLISISSSLKSRNGKPGGLFKTSWGTWGVGAPGFPASFPSRHGGPPPPCNT